MKDDTSALQKSTKTISELVNIIEENMTGSPLSVIKSSNFAWSLLAKNAVDYSTEMRAFSI